MAIESNVAASTPTAARYLDWTSVIAGALTAAALSFILVTFGAAVGLGISSTAPTWRDASVALWILSGIYLLLQALVSFGFGGYVAGRVRRAPWAGEAAEGENRDGFHGLAAWALAVVMGTVLAALAGGAALSGRTPANTTAAHTSAAEPLLSYELDRLYRASPRPSNIDLTAARAEAGRILLTTSGHDGMSADDRTYLIQQVGAATGLAAADSQRRVDNVIANAKTAIARSRRSTIILAFSLATALLVGAVAAWAAAIAGGRHRDGAPVPVWMSSGNPALRKQRTIP
jgi:hypothetical protein